jgi:penicillin-binding protein A
MKDLKVYLGSIFLASALLFAFVQFLSVKEIAHRKKEVTKDLSFLKAKILEEILAQDSWVKEVVAFDKTYTVEYTIDQTLQEYVVKLLKNHPSDHTALVVIDNETGHVLAAHGLQKEGLLADYSLVLSNTHPSASLFKIVTAAALLEKANVGPKTSFDFVGKQTTLYKYQLKETHNKWSRSATLKQAFANSNNAIFGKAAITELDSKVVLDIADAFGFNHDVLSDLEPGKSQVLHPENDFDLAELASGFNVETKLSPVHAAMLSSIVANGGELKKPSLILKVYDQEKAQDLFYDKSASQKAISLNTAYHLRSLMIHTIKEGTAKRSFKKLPRKIEENIIIGGKTGSITGGIPHGKRDWFTAFAVPDDPQYGKGISIAVMNVNVKKWYVKAPFLARKVIEHYYSDLDSISRGLSQLDK